MIYESDFDSQNICEDDPTELFDAKCFTKHGFDILMISNNIPNLLTLQNVQNTPFSTKNGADRANQHIVVNKRA